MTGGVDREYVEARRTLLDALEGLGVQREAAILVGAQAIYLHTGNDDGLAVAPFTSDADISLDPALLRTEPLVEQAMASAGFARVPDPSKVGTWVGRNGVPIDLMVAEAHGGAGRRGARIPPHAEGTARKVRGLEAALVDREVRTLGAMNPADARSFEVWVAGPGALLVAKLIKISERLATPSRLENKDALDVYRLLRDIPLAELATRLKRLREADVSAAVTADALGQLFAVPDGRGVRMAVEATRGLEDAAGITVSCVALASDLLESMA